MVAFTPDGLSSGREKVFIMNNFGPREELSRLKISILKKKKVSTAFVSRGASKNHVKSNFYPSLYILC